MDFAWQKCSYLRVHTKEMRWLLTFPVVSERWPSRKCSGRSRVTGKTEMTVVVQVLLALEYGRKGQGKYILKYIQYMST